MNKIAITFFLITVLIFKLTAQSVDEVFDNYFNATGGRALWDKVKTYTLRQSFVSNAASDYDMEIKASIPDMSMLKTKTIMKRSFIYVISPDDAFYKIPTGSRDIAPVYQTKDLSEKEKMNMRREVNDLFAPFYNYEKKGYIATYVGLESMGVQKVHHIELAGKDIKYDLYFNESSNFLSKQRDKLSSGEEITKEYNTYSTSEFGIKHPTSGTYYSNIDKRNVKLSSIIFFNPVFDSSTFKR